MQILWPSSFACKINPTENTNDYECTNMFIVMLLPVKERISKYESIKKEKKDFICFVNISKILS